MEMFMLWEDETRKAPPEGKQWFSVPVEFVRDCIFEVAAETAEEARKLVEEKCCIAGSKVFTKLPKGHVVWTISLTPETRIGEIMLADEYDPM